MTDNNNVPVMEQQFVSESIKPVIESTDTNTATAGGPVLPHEFIWRKKTIIITSVIRTWHETGPCKHGSPEVYVRKHWYEVETSLNRKAKIYFERQPRGRKITRRWWLFSIENPD